MPASYTLPFIKMQGIGNDFIFLDGEALLDSAARPLLSQWRAIVPVLTKELCHRRLSIGADGLILAMRLEVPELAQLASSFYGSTAKDCQLSWTYHNSDGSLSDICGNGLRCLSLWAKQEKHMNGRLKVATALGPLVLDYQDQNNITVFLNEPRLKASEIPFLGNKCKTDPVIKEQFKLKDLEFSITCVNVGNPHCVIFEADFLKPDLFIPLKKIGQNGISRNDFFPQQLAPIAEAIEVDDRFPEQTNVEFVNVVDRGHIEVFVWERGSKATLASGSCAVAAAIASILEKRTDKRVEVTLPGGTLLIDWSDENVIEMTGSANFSFRGQVEVPTKLLVSKHAGASKVKVL